MIRKKIFFIGLLLLQPIVKGMDSTKRSGCITPVRYGIDLSSQAFDRLIFKPLGKTFPSFSSDHVLCTSTQIVNPECYKSYSELFEHYKCAQLFLFENDIITDLHKPILVLFMQNTIEEYPQLAQDGYSYLSYKKQALANIKICIESIQRDIASCPTYFPKFCPLQAALLKLQDDESSLQNCKFITEQNLIRSFQYCDTTEMDQWADAYTNIHCVNSLYKIHRKCDYQMHRLYFHTCKNAPVAHSSCIDIQEKKKSQREHPYGIFYKKHVDNINDTFSFDQEHSKQYLTADVRYNLEIHGDEGAVWFLFPEDKDFDAGIAGNGTSWMTLENAKQKIQKEAFASACANYKDVLSDKEVFKLIIKLSTLATTAGSVTGIIAYDNLIAHIGQAAFGGIIGFLQSAVLARKNTYEFDTKWMTIGTIMGVSTALQIDSVANGALIFGSISAIAIPVSILGKNFYKIYQNLSLKRK